MDIYEFDELKKIEDKIMEIMENKEYLEELSQNALDFSNENFRKDIIGKAIKDFLNE